MKKFFFFFLIFISLTRQGHAQNDRLDPLKKELEKTSNDTLRYIQLDSLTTIYSEISPDSSYYYSARSVGLARSLGYKLPEAASLGRMGYAQLNMGNYPQALELFLEAMDIAADPNNKESTFPEQFREKVIGFEKINPDVYDKSVQSLLHFYFAILYENLGQFDKELWHLHLAENASKQANDSLKLTDIYYVLGRVYLSRQMPDSTIFYELKSMDISTSRGLDPREYYLNIGKAYMAKKNINQADVYLQNAKLWSEGHYPRGVIAADLLLVEIALNQGRIDSASYYANHALGASQKLNVPDLLLRTYASLAAVYNTRKQFDSASKYQALFIKLKDSIFNSKQLQQFQAIEADQLRRQQEAENQKKDYETRNRTYGLIIGITITLIVAMLLWRNNVLQQKAFGLLKKQKQETEFQKTRVEETLEELKATQAQLVQREKMASLGELTAGVAHEIQNPLNFVKNFSEVNTELATELNDALDKGNVDQARRISQDIVQNLGKIVHHGQRADGIVKGMMLYSLAREGKKESVDLENLINEYLRITYIGFQSSHEGFHANIQTNFDSNFKSIDVIPQDMTRVLSNLFNNAFYSLHEKWKKVNNKEPFEPELTVSTSVIGTTHGGNGQGSRMGEIRVHDNGAGIPEKSISKIFQPFFTLKPSGQGTGLGLSISYDIITREHAGTIEAFSLEGEYAEFVIRIPV
jgi:signal transduction histidine kinase